MKPAARNGDLLYVADDITYDVYVYSYPRGTLVGTLTGFNTPGGECTDRLGNIWIVSRVSNYASRIIKYAHGGTSPIATLSDPAGLADGCAVDLATGNLAVANYINSQGNQPGNIAIYKGAKGVAKIYTNSALLNFWFCGYDNKGNLFADATAASAFVLGELHSGGGPLDEISLSKQISFPGGVQWDGTYVAVGDVGSDVIYQVQVSPSGGKVVGTTPLTGASNPFDFWIVRGLTPKVIAGNNSPSNPVVNIWNYPAGGTPTKTLSGFRRPFSVVVSKGLR